MRSISVALFATMTSLAAISPAAAEGFRAEIHAGYDNVGGNGDRDSGVAYGIGLGYDHKLSDKLLAGIEFNLDDSSQKECATTGTGAATTRSCVRAGRDISVNARLGYKVSERGTLYALAGYTNARFVARSTGATVARAGANLDGFRIGAGYEHDLSERVYAKAEYRYSNYEGGLDRHQVLTGVGLRF
jgi:outer membrane immunogenic protein